MTISWLADKIEQWPTAKLVPYARNSRTHSDAQVAQIAASIAEFGFTNPILAGGDGVIVAGHGRLAAAQKLGLAMVPVVVHERGQAIGLHTAFAERGAEVGVVDVQHVALVDRDVDTLGAAGLAGLPGEVVLFVLPHRQPGEHHVPEQGAAQVTGRRHHPAHAQRRAEFRRLARPALAGADHLLQRHDVGVESGDDRRDTLRRGAGVHAAAAVHVVGGDAHRAGAPCARRGAVAVLRHSCAPYYS